MNSSYRGRIVLSGLSSSCGKTTVSMALMRLLTRKGIPVTPFKVGPDFIDPQLHASAAGVKSRNIDAFLTGASYIRKTVGLAESSGSMSVIEGMMGLYDGLRPDSDFASTAWIARKLDAPVVLVMDASATMRTVAAAAWGVKRFSSLRGVRIEGVILTRTGGDSHTEGCRKALRQSGIEVLGAIPQSADFTIPERHLGLYLPHEIAGLDERISRMADELGRTLDLDLLLRIAASAPQMQSYSSKRRNRDSVRIGVASDTAFNFYYADNIELLRSAGAEIVPFSPTAGRLDDVFDGLYIGGGYPELYAEAISRNGPMLRGLKKASEDGMPVYSECGGFMLLSKYIILGKRKYRMAGLFQNSVEMTGTPVIGYRRIRTAVPTVLGPEGTGARGHEFHYARETGNAESIERGIFLVQRGAGGMTGTEGHAVFNTAGSFIHLHFGSNRRMARHFVKECIDYGRR
ncbi:MAG: cobyrinate a,c-diamide synthase [Thermoplasmata archaeon YP2-bin.285]|uniref:Cobyrinate a,c-diamide synthase n=1 Tax=Candidatus Sysuiplasma superficiale TaxID=2823368 RepID=A0A8J7YKH8_9ARCH|nr:cobyrinate a,c-diamide synthase [Candidatus Sysuiplasma superficiale]